MTLSGVINKPGPLFEIPPDTDPRWVVQVGQRIVRPVVRVSPGTAGGVRVRAVLEAVKLTRDGRRRRRIRARLQRRGW